MALTKRQREMLVLLLVVVLTGGVVAFMFIRPSTYVPSTYVPRSVDVSLDAGVLANPEYRDLQAPPVNLPVRPVKTGRDNPFIPY